MSFAIISETFGLVAMRDNERDADEVAIMTAVNTGHTVYVKPASEVTA